MIHCTILFLTEFHSNTDKQLRLQREITKLIRLTIFSLFFLQYLQQSKVWRTLFHLIRLNKPCSIKQQSFSFSFYILVLSLNVVQSRQSNRVYINIYHVSFCLDRCSSVINGQESLILIFKLQLQHQPFEFPLRQTMKNKRKHKKCSKKH